MNRAELDAVIDGLRFIAEANVDHPDRKAAIVALYEQKRLAQSVLDVLFHAEQRERERNEQTQH